ncbi:hypothetical protein BGX38DRAFT_1170690 [Terfezia claveryi]|nr:hypothetical protein BGX38DRAFT_1170690 [Terfezia claveryi]
MLPLIKPILPRGVLLRSQLQRPHHPVLTLATFKTSPRPSQILVRSIHDWTNIDDIYTKYETGRYNVKEGRMELITRTNEHIDPAPEDTKRDPAPEDTKPDVTTDIPELVTKWNHDPLAFSVINAKLAAIQTKTSEDTQSIKTAVGNLSSNISAKLDEFKSGVATLGQEPSLAKFLEEFKSDDIQMTKELKGMADKIGVICNVINGFSIRIDSIDSRIDNVKMAVYNIAGDIGGTEIKVDPQANEDNAAMQRAFTATTATAMEWTKVLICSIEEVIISMGKIESMAFMHSKPAPVTKDIENATQQLVDSIRIVEAKLGEVRAVEVAMDNSFSRLEDSTKLGIKSLEEKVDESTKKVEKLEECVQQNMGNLAIFIADYNGGQRNIQSSIGQMESQINARLCRIEEASLKRVLTESTKEQATKSSERKWDLFNVLSTPGLVLILMLLTATLILFEEIADAKRLKRVKEDKALATTAVKATEEMGGGNGGEQKNKRAWGLWQ